VTEAVFTLEPALYGNLLSQRSGGATYCYHFDAVGSTSQLTDASQDVVNAYIYLAFGEIIDKQEAVDNEFRYVGQLGYQSEVDLFTYVRRRYYAASYGRWLSRDPVMIGPSVGNAYGYVGDRPTLKVDPSGLYCEDMDYSCTVPGAVCWGTCSCSININPAWDDLTEGAMKQMLKMGMSGNLFFCCELSCVCGVFFPSMQPKAMSSCLAGMIGGGHYGYLIEFQGCVCT